MAASVEVVKPRGQYDEVVVHPLVLLSVVDHFRAWRRYAHLPGAPI